MRERIGGGWSAAVFSIAALLAGVLIGVALTKWKALRFSDEIDIADFASLMLSIATLILVPAVLSRVERRSTFDRRVLAERLEPARTALFEIEDALRSLESDAMEPALRTVLVRQFQGLRTNVERSQRIAALWGAPPAFIANLDDAESLARQLNRLVTGGEAHTRRSDALQVSRELQDTLLDLLRSVA